jgi:hypothetical protein
VIVWGYWRLDRDEVGCAGEGGFLSEGVLADVSCQDRVGLVEADRWLLDDASMMIRAGEYGA